LLPTFASRTGLPRFRHGRGLGTAADGCALDKLYGFFGMSGILTGPLGLREVGAPVGWRPLEH
jgi:hypothetical protein